MVYRYVISDYEEADNKTPRIRGTNDLTEAQMKFQESAERRVRSVVLYDTQTDTVIRIAIDGPPKYLCRAIEKAREELKPDCCVSNLTKTAAKKAAEMTIAQIVQSLTGADLVSLFLVPYYLIKGDNANAAAAAGTMVGAFVGGEVATKVGGSKWRTVGCMVGGATAGACIHAFVKSQTPPKPLCNHCRGTGLVLDFRRCERCNGKGYCNSNV